MDYRADCSRCQGICCVSLPFDRSESFAFDKAADVPCRHLNRANRCTIHSDLERRGCGGCARYECYGAGQRVTQALFPGRSWRESPALARSMFETFRRLKRIHELSVLLDAARSLHLTDSDERQRCTLKSELEPPSGWLPETV
ncbi:MAG TPA: hypothetical protein VGK73_15680, partial [Polyangiaceae bacterium]